MTKSQLKQLIRETINETGFKDMYSGGSHAKLDAIAKNITADFASTGRRKEAPPPSTGRRKDVTPPQWVVTFSGYGIGGEYEFSVVVRGANEQAAISNGKRYVQRHKEELIGYERDILDDLASVKAEPLKQ